MHCILDSGAMYICYEKLGKATNKCHIIFQNSYFFTLSYFVTVKDTLQQYNSIANECQVYTGSHHCISFENID